MNDMLKKELTTNCYEILEVSMGADEEEIRRSYDNIKRIYAEDSIAIYGLYTQKEIRKLKDQIEKAFRILIDPENRQAYDNELLSIPVKKKKHIKISVKHSGDDESENIAQKKDGSDISDGQEDSRNKVQREADSKNLNEDIPKPQLPIIVDDELQFSGEVLIELRKAHNIKLRMVSDTTKVSMTNLRLLEAEDWKKLPAMVYVKGFISQYAKYLGIDSKRMLADLLERYEGSKEFTEE